MSDKSDTAVQSLSADVSGTRLHYLLAGDPAGPPVLLWHGFLSTCQAWRRVIPMLAESGFAVLAPDMRGFGDSDKPPGEDGYDARAMAEQFRALARQIGFGGGKPLLLVGHDFGAPPALLWAADHPEEVAGLVYAEAPVMLSSVLTKVIAYTPQAMSNGSLWWWILPLADGVLERLVVGNERAFLEWFYDNATARRDAISPADVDETLRTYAGREGVLGAAGVYRVAFTTIAQTDPLLDKKVTVPVVALGGEKGLGENVPKNVKLVAENVAGGVIADCGHFMPEERPDVIVDRVRAMWDDVSAKAKGNA